MLQTVRMRYRLLWVYFTFRELTGTENVAMKQDTTPEILEMLKEVR